MEHRVFLGKYRVATTKSAHWWDARRSHLGLKYEAEEMGSGGNFALELIPLFLLDETERAELRKAAPAAQAIRHPNLPTLQAWGEEGEQFVLVTEEFDGSTAREWIASHGPMPIAAALSVTLQVLSALRVAARHNLSHPALHPGNLLFVPGRKVESGGPLVKVLRFLSPGPPSRAFDLAHPVLADAIFFASPEQVADGLLDFRSEIYSLGVILWFLLSAAPPGTLAGGLEIKRMADSRPRPFAGLPESVDALLEDMLAEDREERPAEAGVLEKRIRNCLAEVETGAVLQPIITVLSEKSTTCLQPPAGWRSRLIPLATAAAALLVATGVVLLLSMGSQSSGPAQSWPELTQAQTARAMPGRDRAQGRRVTTPQAMNFSVVAPSYDSNGSQIRSVSAPGRPVSRKPSIQREPEAPAEGPAEPAVEVPSKTRRDPPPAGLNPSALEPGDRKSIAARLRD